MTRPPLQLTLWATCPPAVCSVRRAPFNSRVWTDNSLLVSLALHSHATELAEFFNNSRRNWCRQCVPHNMTRPPLQLTLWATCPPAVCSAHRAPFNSRVWTDNSLLVSLALHTHATELAEFFNSINQSLSAQSASHSTRHVHSCS